MEKQRPSTINRVIHRDPEEVARGMHLMQDNFATASRPHLAERKKTIAETDIITSISTYMKNFVEDYGGVYVPLTSGHISILHDENKLSEKERSELEAGCQATFSTKTQKINVYEANDPSLSLLSFAKNSVHEMLHANSYQTATVNANLIQYNRAGLFINNPSVAEPLGDLDEAMTEELAKRFMTKYEMQLPHVQQEVARKKKIQNEEIAYPCLDYDEEGSLIFTSNFGQYVYQKERKELWETIDTIAQKSEGEKSSEDVFDVFARAYFSHDMQPLSSMVNNTFGPGSMKQLLHK